MPNRGSKHHSAKLTEAKVRAIRRLYWVKGLQVNCLAKMYGYRYAIIWDCVQYRTWIQVRDTFKACEITRAEIG